MMFSYFCIAPIEPTQKDNSLALCDAHPQALDRAKLAGLSKEAGNQHISPATQKNVQANIIS